MGDERGHASKHTTRKYTIHLADTATRKGLNPPWNDQEKIMTRILWSHDKEIWDFFTNDQSWSNTYNKMSIHDMLLEQPPPMIQYMTYTFDKMKWATHENDATNSSRDNVSFPFGDLLLVGFCSYGWSS